MFEVFVSYSHEDKEDVESVVRRLHEEAGIRTWVDRWNLVAGESWQEPLQKAIVSSATFAIFLGPNGISEWQGREIQCANQASAENSQVRVIPVLLPGGPRVEELPPLLRLRDCVNFTGPDGVSNETEFRRLVNGIRKSPNGVEEAFAEGKLRTALLDYYQTQEAGCEHLVFASSGEAELKGSDLFVPLHLLTERIGPLASKGTSETVTDSSSQKSKAQKLKRHRFVWRKSVNENERDPEQEAVNNEAERTRERESWDTVFRNDGLRLVFIGGAGSGKSFSLTQEIRKRLSQARKQLEGSHPLHDVQLPIFVRASVLVASAQERVADALLASVFESNLPASTHFSNWWRRAFESERGCRLFIVIDGLDELSDESERRFRKLMEELDALESANLIISCRTMYLGSRRAWIGWSGRRTRVVEMAPLDEEQQFEMVENWSRDDDVQREALRSLLETNYAVRLSCRTPLLLTLVCWIRTTTNRFSGSMSYELLYKIVTEEFLMGRWRDPSKRPAWTFNKSQVDLDSALQDRITFVSRTVWKLFETSQSENRFTIKQWRDAFGQIRIEPGLTHLNAQTLLSELECIGMLIDAGYSRGVRYYSFAHRTLLEYFAAVGLLEQDATWMKTVVKHMWCETGWGEVIRFAASKTNEPAHLLDHIAKETGLTTDPWRPLESLSGLCKAGGCLSLCGLVLIAVLIGQIIGNSPEIQDQLKQRGAHDFQLLRSISWGELTNSPLQTLKAGANSLLDVYTGFRDSSYKQVINSSDEQKYVYLQIEWVHPFLIIVLVMLLVTLLGVFLSWLTKAIFYRISFLKQDDVFRTGLRLQAEVVGLNEATPVKHVRRVVKELLSSEKIRFQKYLWRNRRGLYP